MWKENVMEELEAGEVEYELVEEFLTILKKEFGGGEEEAVKAAELRRVEQGGKTMEEYVQEFKRIARGSGYKGRPLVEEFKRGMNRGIRRKLIETKNPPASIEQWYKKAMALDRNQRESKKEEERLKRKQEKKTSTFWQPLALINRGSKIQVWPRRQEMQQQTSMGPVPIERIERTNAVVVRGLGQDAGVPPRWDLFAMEVDREQNCYACGGFRHMACHCRNWGQRGRVGDNRRVEYGGGRIEEIVSLSDNLKEGKNLKLLN